MPPDYSNKDLTGYSFRGKKLQGANFEKAILTRADFSHADIRGAKFKNAVLHDANFSHAQMGLPAASAFFFGVFALVLAFLAVPITLFSGISVGSATSRYGNAAILSGIVTISFFAAVLITRGTGFGLKLSVYSFPILIAVALSLNFFIPRNATIYFVSIVVSIFAAVILSIVGVMCSVVNTIAFIFIRAIFGKGGLIASMILVPCLVFFIILIVIVVSILSKQLINVAPPYVMQYEITQDSLNELKSQDVPEAVIAKLRRIEGREYLSESEFRADLEKVLDRDQTLQYQRVIVKSARRIGRTIQDVGLYAFLITVLVVIASIYLTVCGVADDPKHSLIRRTAVRITSKFGTSFERADLFNAKFAWADLRNANFKDSRNAVTCYWEKAKDREFANELIALLNKWENREE